MRRSRRTGASIAVALVAAIAGAAALAGCGGGAGSFDSPPPSLDPNSPSLIAEGIAFNTAQLEVPANRPFTLVFENRDTASHNVSILTNGDELARVFDSTPFGGPATRWYPVPALAPGRYKFVCDLHTNMVVEVIAR
jgi:plastocyanin